MIHHSRTIALSVPVLGSILLVCCSPAAMAQNLSSSRDAPVGTGLQMVQHRSPYDGRWIANVPPQGACPPSRLSLNVRGSFISGTAVNPSGVFPIEGSLGPQGAGTIRIVQMGGTIRFAGNRFVANYFNVCGPRRAVGTRVAVPRSAMERI
jgi:hypothetical protein